MPSKRYKAEQIVTVLRQIEVSIAVWGCAGLGLLLGGAFANWLGRRLSFDAYNLTVFRRP